MAANCICNSSLLQNNFDNNDSKNKNNKKEIITFKKLTKTIIENLFNLNIDVFKCYNLVFNKKIFYNNIGFYCMSILYILQMICLFIYLYKRLRPIKLFMLIFSSYNQKVANSYPPPKNKKKIISSFEDDNKYTNNNNPKNSKIKLRNIRTNLNELKSKVPLLNKGNKDFNSMHKLLVKDKRKIILPNNYTSNINIQNKIININNRNKMNKKRLQKGIMLQESNKTSKLLSIKSNKNLFYKDIGNKSIKGNKKSK